MSEVMAPCVYFKNTGKANTQRALGLAFERARDLKIETVLVASTSGETGLAAARLMKGLDVIVVSHSAGFKAANEQEISYANMTEIQAAGGRVLTCQHAFGGVNRSIRKKWGTYQVDEIIAQTFRIFCEGMKVAVEMALMAADAGMVRTDTPLISIAGTSSGADTALVLIPANATDFFNLKILEFVCMPSPMHPNVQ